MIDLRKSLSAECRYTPGVVYVTAPDASFGYRVKEAFEFSPGGCGVAPEVRVQVDEGSRKLTLAARRLNVRNRFTGAVLKLEIDIPADDAAFERYVRAFTGEWFDLDSQIIGDLTLNAYTEAKDQSISPQASLVIFYVLKFKRMPPLEVLKLIHGEPLEVGKLSRIEIDSDTQIRLPELIDKPLALNPLQRTVYILFLRHAEGIVLRLISDYARELEDIYQIVKGTADAARAREAIANLCDPINGTLHQQLSRIKQKILKVLPNKHLADLYAIQGRHSEPYRIAAVATVEVEFIAPAWLR